MASARLQEQLAHHLDLHQRAYGVQYVRPKHHWNMDVPQQVSRDSRIVDAFIIERIHLQVKWIAEAVKTHQTWEQSVLAGVLNCSSAAAAAADNVFGGLRGSTAPMPDFPAATVADRLEHHGMKVSAGDFVAKGNHVGNVVACAREGEGLYVVVDLWRHVAAVSLHSGKYLPTGARDLWRSQDVFLPLAWYAADDGSVVVVRM